MRVSYLLDKISGNKHKMAGLVEKTESLSSSGFATLVSDSDCILDQTIIEIIEQDRVSFDGGDEWIFDQYAIRINKLLLPVGGDAHWTNNTLSMPGRKSTQNNVCHLEIGGRYLAFYNYSAMARGYSLEGLMEWSDDRVVRINSLTGK